MSLAHCIFFKRDSAWLDIWTEPFNESQDSLSGSQICLDTQSNLQLIVSVKAKVLVQISSQAKSLARQVFSLNRSDHYFKFLPELAGLKHGLTCVSLIQRSVSSPCVSALPLSSDRPQVFLLIPPFVWTVVQSKQYKNHTSVQLINDKI